MWIRIKVKSRIRIRIKRVWIRNTDFWGDVLYCNIKIGSENVGDVVQRVRNDVLCGIGCWITNMDIKTLFSKYPS
jgi:hypothetical protein